MTPWTPSSEQSRLIALSKLMDNAKYLFGMPVRIRTAMPEDMITLEENGKVVGTIVNIGASEPQQTLRAKP